MNSTFSTPAARRVGAREVEHLVGHVDADRLAGRADAAGGDQDVGAGAGAEVEHGLALAQVGDGGRHAAAERCGDRGLGSLGRARRRRARRPRPRLPCASVVRVVAGSVLRDRTRRRRTCARTTSRMSVPSADGCLGQPQVEASGVQQSALSVGSQQVVCCLGRRSTRGSARHGAGGQLSHADSSLRASGMT